MEANLPDLPDTPIGRCLAGWKRFLAGEQELATIVADDAVLHSPVLHRPQRGKDLVVLYLTGASMSFGGDGAETAASFDHPGGGTWDGRFHYVRTILGEHDAVLEFETVMAGSYVNGVDLVTCDADGLIVDFKVMVRPARAVDAVRERMLAALQQLGT